MKLYAISDLHLAVPDNRAALAVLPAYPEDWLIVAGDVGETVAHLHQALQILTRRFARVLWVPGNHDLWTVETHAAAPRGEAKYRQLVGICREYGVLTPEDPWAVWPGPGPACHLALLFLLYDYSFRPAHLTVAEALAAAEAAHTVCTDEILLHPDPYATRAAWCAARCAQSEARLAALPAGAPVILINHFPLRRDLVRLARIPHFTIWCGTEYTRDWHVRYNVQAVVSGHLHMRATDYRAGVRFEEVSLGYMRQWRTELGIQGYLREILPGPAVAVKGDAGPFWRF